MERECLYCDVLLKNVGTEDDPKWVHDRDPVWINEDYPLPAYYCLLQAEPKLPGNQRNRLEDGRCANCGDVDPEHDSTACLYKEMAAVWAAGDGD